ncbi:holin family protein [Parasalinivibrio latis]|uniref:3TM-type holin n=1 Tax=Parasalinivibrio latis TaxID=2952610 RepID=UPI0030E4ED2A
MSVWNVLSGLVSPITELIDELHTSDEERLAIKAKMLELQMNLATQVMDYEARLIEAKTQVITAEANGGSWLQRSWRPVTMLAFLALVVADSFGLLAFRLAPQAWTLLQIGLGGYVVGRSVEKVMPSIATLLPGAKS